MAYPCVMAQAAMPTAEPIVKNIVSRAVCFVSGVVSSHRSFAALMSLLMPRHVWLLRPAVLTASLIASWCVIGLSLIHISEPTRPY